MKVLGDTLAIPQETLEQWTLVLQTDEEKGRHGWSEYLVRKGRLVAVQDAGVIQHHPLGDQQDDAVPEPGDHLSVGEGDGLPAETGGNTEPRSANSHGKAQKSFVTSTYDSETPKQSTADCEGRQKGGCLSCGDPQRASR